MSTAPLPPQFPLRRQRSIVRTWRGRWFPIMALCCLGWGTFSLCGCTPVPQVLDSEKVFGELDALYTAVTSKRTNLLNDCRARLTKLHDAKELSDAGFDEVTAIMDLCDDEEWSTAAERLFKFMRGQRKPTNN